MVSLNVARAEERERPDGTRAYHWTMADSSLTTSGDGPQRPPHDFDAIYAVGNPPWDIGRPQPAFGALAKSGKLVGSVLDVGCGTGEHTLMAASFGHDALGVDLSSRAIDLAKAKAVDRGIDARFSVADALQLGDLDEQFDTVLDCGLFHVLDDDARERYVTSLAGVLPAGPGFRCSASATASPVTGGHGG